MTHKSAFLSRIMEMNADLWSAFWVRNSEARVPDRLPLNPTPANRFPTTSGPGKHFPGATGLFIDNDGLPWQVMRIRREGKPTLYLRWDIDGEDMGGSFVDGDGVYVEPFSP